MGERERRGERRKKKERSCRKPKKAVPAPMVGTSLLKKAKRASWQTSPGRKPEGEAKKEAGESKLEEVNSRASQPSSYLPPHVEGSVLR